MSKQNERKYLARLITEFVNRNSKDPHCLPQGFIEKYGIPRYRFGANEVAWIAQAFRQAWDHRQKDSFAENMEQVFADRRDEVYRELDAQAETVFEDETRMPDESDSDYERRRAAILERQSRAGTRFAYQRGNFPKDLGKYTRPAFRVVPGKRGLVFAMRDPLDRMALELLRAFSSNRLRVCGREGKGCPTPLFVAYHSKQKYCYRGCSEQALSEWQADLWAKRKKKKSSAKRRVTP